MGNSITSSCSNCKRKPDKPKPNIDHINNCNVLNDVNSITSISKTIPNDNLEPFYLHPPLNERTLEAPHAPENGLYINPMDKHRHSVSSSSDGGSTSGSLNGEPFYLHKEGVYTRVNELFKTQKEEKQSLSGLKVEVEVHSSGSGGASDENLSSSDISERSGDHEHDYEDIYLVRQDSSNKLDQNNNRSQSRDSGSHSRTGSVSSSNSAANVVLRSSVENGNSNSDSKVNEIVDTQEQIEKIEKRDSVSSGPHSRRSSAELTDKSKSSSPLSSSPKHFFLRKNGDNNSNNSRILTRATSSPLETSPPPPPPPPPVTKSMLRVETDNEPRGAESVEIVEEPTLKPSAIAKGMHKSMTAISARRLNSSCSDLTIVSLDGEDNDKHGVLNLVNKKKVLPFVPPSFPGIGNSNHLIKPSEYLRSISDKASSVSPPRSVADSEDSDNKLDFNKENPMLSPPPPPPPEILLDVKFAAENDSETTKKQNQPLSTISIEDLNSVRLRRTDKMPASKTFSAPLRSISLQCLTNEEAYMAQKTDLIAELKMSRDITGIKKMKVERAKKEETLEKELISEISKQFSPTKFVEKVPEKDNTGNIIPPWKRQMLAKKAAEKAKKELEEKLHKEAEEKRLRSIPQWKRQLLQKKEESDIKTSFSRTSLYTPKLVEEPRVHKVHMINDATKTNSLSKEENKDANNNDDSIKFEQLNDNDQSDEEPSMIIPWRAKLRKTNSTLNLLE